MFVVKILLMMLLNKNVFVWLDTVLLIKHALNVHQTTSFKTIIALLALLTLLIIQLQKNVNVQMDSFWVKKVFVLKNVQTIKFTTLNQEPVIALLD